MRGVRIACAVLFGTLLAAPAAAHRLAPSLLEARELGSGRVEVRWKTPQVQPRGGELQPELPDHCPPVGAARAERGATGVTLRWRVDCGSRGLVGATLRVRGLRESRTAALVRVELEDGRTVQAVLDAERDAFEVPARQGARRVAGEYLALGGGHILGGLDHLLFVLGLVLLVSGRRALVLTVTAFTAGHCVTLSLAALGFVRFSPRPVEFAIALSVLVLAVELANGTRQPRRARASLLRRQPWTMALLFGLLHGLGFAGALARVGLPAEEIPLALLSFNAGIELGQLAVVAAVLGGALLLRPAFARGPAWLVRAPAYGIGSLAAFWCFQRAFAA